MGLTSTQLITYSEIEIKNTDLFEDAFGVGCEFADVIAFLKAASFEPGEDLLKKLLASVKEIN